MGRSIAPFVLAALIAPLCAIGCDDSTKPAPAASATARGSASPTSSASAGVRFGTPKPEVGDEYTTTLMLDNTFEHTDPELPGIIQKNGMGMDMVVKSEVLAVSGDREIKWKQTYEKAAMTMVRDGKPSPLPSHIEGNTYIVERNGDELTATTADGETLTEAGDLEMLATPIDSLVPFELPDRAYEVGQEVPELSSQMAEKEGKMNVTTRFAERKGDTAVFEAKSTVTPDGGLSMKMRCRSTVRITDGRRLSHSCETADITQTRQDKSKSTGRMKITVTRTYTKGGTAVAAKSTAAPAAKPSGKGAPFDAVCYGETKLTDKQRYYIMSQIDEGKDDPCPGFTAPTLMADANGMTLNGQELLAKDGLPGADNLVQIEPLFKRLTLYRKRWKSHTPTKPFDGKLTIKAAAGTATALVASAYITAGRAGYRTVTIESGSQSVELTFFFPGPPEQGPPKHVLYVEPLAGGKAIAGFLEEGPALDKKKKLAAMTELDAWLTARCGETKAKPCVDRIVFRPRKDPIEQTIEALQPLMKAKAFGDKPAPISLEFSCAVSPAPTRQEAVRGPWGPRTPDQPCF